MTDDEQTAVLPAAPVTPTVMTPTAVAPIVVAAIAVAVAVTISIAIARRDEHRRPVRHDDDGRRAVEARSTMTAVTVVSITLG